MLLCIHTKTNKRRTLEFLYFFEFELKKKNHDFYEVGCYFGKNFLYTKGGLN